MSKNRTPKSDAQYKAELRRLKKLGLYKGNLRKKSVSDYGKRVARKYADVIEGRAAVLTAPKTKRSKGFKTAKEIADRQGYEAVRDKIIVRNKRKGEIDRIVKGRVVRYVRLGGELYTYEDVKRNRTSISDLPELKDNQTYIIPFARRKNGRQSVEWLSYSAEDLARIAAEYPTKQNSWKDILDFVQIATRKPGR